MIQTCVHLGDCPHAHFKMCNAMRQCAVIAPWIPRPARSKSHYKSDGARAAGMCGLACASVRAVSEAAGQQPQVANPAPGLRRLGLVIDSHYARIGLPGGAGYLGGYETESYKGLPLAVSSMWNEAPFCWL